MGEEHVGFVGDELNGKEQASGKERSDEWGGLDHRVEHHKVASGGEL